MMEDQPEIQGLSPAKSGRSLDLHRRLWDWRRPYTRRDEQGMVWWHLLVAMVIAIIGGMIISGWPTHFLQTTPAGDPTVQLASVRSAPFPGRTEPKAPILLIKGPTSTFGDYYAEILRTEGINEFDVADVSMVSSTLLSNYDLVILAKTSLARSQVEIFSNWVASGGNLIAMAPDPQLAGLLGLVSTGTTLSNGYLLVNGSTNVGHGIVNQTIQFHGTAHRYLLSGAESLATLYATATNATGNPAITLHKVGSSGGLAAAFTYDLASSVIYTRQGNPAWATQERDGQPAIRPNDKFFGAAVGDRQADWVDLTKIAIPQADEQQRLLANLILQMNHNKKPLPRFWYFPNGKRAVIIMTGDDHGRNGTSGRFTNFIARSPAGCSVANWECIRGTSYIFLNTPLTDAQAADYTAQGFEISLHINTGCHQNFTLDSLKDIYAQQVTIWRKKYSSIPAPATQRHHCVVWSDWASAAKVQKANGMRLDTTYYFWPAHWVKNTPGLFTGSAMPMRFADLDGTVIDVYGAATHMTDESGQDYPYTVDTLLDRALGPDQYFGAFTVNAHTDRVQSAVSDAVITSALGRGVPVVSARQMLTWLDGRNSSSFKKLSWNGNTLKFSVIQGSNANGLQALLPMQSNAGTLSSITRDGHPVDFTAFSVKGIEYGIFPAIDGSYSARYVADVASTTASNPLHAKVRTNE